MCVYSTDKLKKWLTFLLIPPHITDIFLSSEIDSVKINSSFNRQH